MLSQFFIAQMLEKKEKMSIKGGVAAVMYVEKGK